MEGQQERGRKERGKTGGNKVKEKYCGEHGMQREGKDGYGGKWEKVFLFKMAEK